MDDFTKHYRQLNDQQKMAVDTVDGPLLVLAGPGTGKTQLLSVRAGSILRKKIIQPENIILLTYTNSASKVMKERLAKIIGTAGYNINVCTFHSFANSVILESEEAANYVGDKIQMDDVERMQVIEYILDNTKGLDDIRPFRAPYMYAKEILSRISELKKEGITPAILTGYLKNRSSRYRSMEEKYVKRLHATAAIYAQYEELKEGRNKDVFDERGRYDFDDMILFATESFRKEPELQKKYREQYLYVMVDEYQDTNGAQLELLFTLFDYKNPNICCVGDDDQSIYRFQGASVGNFRLLSKQYPDLKTITLRDNYRSSRELIAISDKIINLVPSKERMGQKPLDAVRKWPAKEIGLKVFTTEAEELLFLANKVLDLKRKIASDSSLTADERDHPYNSIAILVRKRNDILKIIDTFLRAGIPYATDGKENVSGERRVRQLIDILELAHIDPAEHELKDLALYKILSADYFQIPQSDILRFISHANHLAEKRAQRRGILLEEYLKYFLSESNEIRFSHPENLRIAANAIAHLLEDAGAKPVHTMLMNFVKEAGLIKFILKGYSKNNILKIRDLRSLSSFINMVKTSDLARPAIRLDDFMAELKTRKDHDLPIQGNLVTLTQDGVRVYTAHGSKGLEFHSVIIPFCLHNKNWPASPLPDRIQLPSDLFKARQETGSKPAIKDLNLQDEIRLFYVAATRARSNLIFTASPSEDSITSLYFDGMDIRQELPERIDESTVTAESLKVTDLEDPFIGTDSVMDDIVSNLTLNPTRLNTYISCRRKFLYNDMLKLPGPKKNSLVFGNCVHKALEDTYREYIRAKRFPSYNFFIQAFKGSLRFQGVDKAMERECLHRTITLKRWFNAISKDPIMPIGLEKKLFITFGDNIVFTGKYDKVEWDDEDKGYVRILDYKTGKPDEHIKDIYNCQDLASDECDGYYRQLVAYKLLFERDLKESAGRRVSHGVLVFTEPLSGDIKRQGYKKGEYVSKSVSISDQKAQELEKIIIETWQNIKKRQFQKLPSRDPKKCGMCDFDPLCWEAK